MGYWDIHPMAGDYPADIECRLIDLLFESNEQNSEKKYDIKEIKKRLKNKLQEAFEMNYPEDCTFVLPFKIAEVGLRIEDEVLSKKIKNMIKDGGAERRGYPMNIESSKLNNYNNFQSPYDYAKHLYDEWDDLMNGKKEFSILSRAKDLFEVLDEDIINSQNGLVNKK